MAIVERSNEAWTAIYRQYHQLMVSWVRQSAAITYRGESPEDLADRAFARAWMALTPDQFAQFSGLPALLAYLRSCVNAAVIDDTRAVVTRERACRRLQYQPVETPEDLVVAANMRAELWQAIGAQLLNQAERVLIDESYLLGLRPRAIYRRHPDLFASVRDIYAVKRNLLARLARGANLQHFRNTAL